MPIPNGTQFGPYEIAGWLGAGAMGEVYRARDLRLERQVALKVVPERFVADAARLDRFRQEARAAGQLNHPNITAVYDSGVHAGMPYIVSELLEGESIRSRLEAGSLPVGKAIEYACQIAEGLAAAHDRSILHRDLKPDNLFVTAEGRVKILDFGIAKLLRAADEGAAARQDTEPGLILGTVSYMSPEQLRGEPLDFRSDIFSVGVILREMLTGRQAFRRETTAETMAAILKEEPSGEFPATASPALKRIVSRCLEKSREARFQSARDLAFGLQFLSGTDTALPARQDARHLASLGRLLPWTLAGALSIALAASVIISAPWTPAPSHEPLRLIANLGGDAPLAPLNVQYGNAVELSPDGSTIAFVARPSAETPPVLYVRRLNQTRATALAGTEDAISPFFSPDSKWIGFFAHMKLQKIAATGGAPIAIADAISGRGGTWASDGTIVFQADMRPNQPLARVSEAGGTAVALSPLAEGEVTEVWPQVLPSGHALIYTSSVVAGAYNDANVMGRLLPDGPPHVIVRGGYHGRALPSGQLVYIHDNTLFAAPFDPVRLGITAPAVPALEGVLSNGLTGGAQFSVSNDGTLVYLPGLSDGNGTRLQWMDRAGRTTTLRGAIANWFTPVFSPDGARLAMEIRERTAQGDIWVYEPARDAMTRLTTNPAQDTRPAWTPDGLHVAFASDQSAPGTTNLYIAPADGGREAMRLTTSANAQQPGSWHPSGKFLAFEEMNPVTRMDVMILPVARDEQSNWKAGAPTAFVNTTRMEWDPAFSPDGRWIAYASSESPNDFEVFVQPFPGPGPRVQVSIGGGEAPVWSRTKRELLYGADGQIMAVSYTTDAGSFRPSAPRAWSPGRYQTRGRTVMFDLHPDGERVALAPAAEAPNGGRRDQAVFVFNFFDELKRLTRSSTR